MSSSDLTDGGRGGEFATAAPAAGGAALELHHLSKTFAGMKALDDVDLVLERGEVHALLGANGSGKSTLIKILSGYHAADPGGTLAVAGQEFEPQHGHHHDEVRFVHQDLGLFGELSAAENIALHGEFVSDRTGRVKWREQRARAQKALDRLSLGERIDVTRPVNQLTPVQRTIVAIAAALFNWDASTGVLVLDEPTAVLPPYEVDLLLRVVDDLRREGAAILYVSHRLDEVIRMADRVTVLRAGRLVHSSALGTLRVSDLASLIVGSALEETAAYDLAPTVDLNAPPALELRGLTSSTLAGIDLTVRKGEIVGFFGLPGSGANEVPYAVAGMLPGAGGEARFGEFGWLAAKDVKKLGVPIVPADRIRESIIGPFSVQANLSLRSLSRLSVGGTISRAREKKQSAKWIADLRIRTPSAESAITNLSGGNQQKVILARCLATDPTVVALCEPTAGVDIGARYAIHTLVRSQAERGCAFVVWSTDTTDFVGMCSTVFIMKDGAIARRLDGAQITEPALLAALEQEEALS